MADKATIATCVAVLCEAYRRKPAPTTYTAFELGLEDLSNEDAMRATKLALKQKSSFMPTPAELIELARTGGVSYEAQAAVAWEELERALNANRPSMMSPATAAVARSIGGFATLREMPLAEFGTWKRKDFVATYVALSRENPERLAAIAGPRSELAVGFRKLPSREELAAIEQSNRKKLQKLN